LVLEHCNRATLGGIYFVFTFLVDVIAAQLNPRDEAHMHCALVLARDAALAGEVPVGCVLVDAAGTVVGSARNEREATFDPTAHAEVLALRRASQLRASYRLTDLTCYVTLEPCAMCAGALVNARVSRVVYALSDEKAGALHSHLGIGMNDTATHRFEVARGVLEAESRAELQAFFTALRKSGKNGRRGNRV
jgi:tRNA(adenine34) deaminase